MPAENETARTLAAGALQLAQHLRCAFDHRLPPVVGILFRAAVGQDLQRVFAHRASEQFQTFAQAEQARLGAGRPQVVADRKRGAVARAKWKWAWKGCHGEYSLLAVRICHAGFCEPEKNPDPNLFGTIFVGWAKV